MAVTTATVLAGTTSFIVDVTATADTDTVTASIPHGLGAIPLDVSVALLQAVISNWAVITIDATNIVAEKTVEVGSGAAGAQVRIRVSLPHTVVR